MTIKVNSDNLIFLNNLNSASDRLATAMSRLSTGIRVKNAADDAAGFMISKGLEVKQRGLNTANNNIQMAFVQTDILNLKITYKRDMDLYMRLQRYFFN